MSKPTIDVIQRVALVSHDYKVKSSQRHRDYSEHARRIHELCERQGCDTILYALYTWDDRSRIKRTNQMFDGLTRVRRIIVETGRPIAQPGPVEIWSKGCRQCVSIKQAFSKSEDSQAKKQQFIEDLPRRMVGANGFLLICGESNVVMLSRKTRAFLDPFGFMAKLVELNVSVILNPVHTYMRRYEMRAKRRYYSQPGRTVVSVWNKGKGRGESPIPWTVFHDGRERTKDVQEIPTPFPEHPDIRIGVVDLRQLRTS